MVDENMAHHLGSDTEEMCAILPLWRFLTNQTQISLVYQRGALQGVIGTFVPKVLARQATQFAVNDGD